MRYVDLNDNDDDYAAVPIEVAVKGYSGNAVVFDRESYFSDLGEEWLNGTDMVDDFHGGIVNHSNACIKAFTIAPNDDEMYESMESKTIMGIVPSEFNTPYESIKTVDIPQLSQVTLTAQGVSPNEEVSVYLADKSRTYEPVATTNSSANSTQAKGLSGPREWALMPLYTAGYAPDFFTWDDGINYPTYGPFIVKADELGRLAVDVDALTYGTARQGKFRKPITACLSLLRMNLRASSVSISSTQRAAAIPAILLRALPTLHRTLHRALTQEAAEEEAATPGYSVRQR